jgi:hypothetical protein
LKLSTAPFAAKNKHLATGSYPKIKWSKKAVTEINFSLIVKAVFLRCLELKFIDAIIRRFLIVNDP